MGFLDWTYLVHSIQNVHTSKYGLNGLDFLKVSPSRTSNPHVSHLFTYLLSLTSTIKYFDHLYQFDFSQTHELNHLDSQK